MGIDRSADVTWRGGLFEGSGTIERVTSGAIGPLEVSWPSRTEAPDGRTSPEELIAAAHAACYCMQLSHDLDAAGSTPREIRASATVTLEVGTGITHSRIVVQGTVPGIDDAEFQAIADRAKANCPVSGALAGNVELSVTATLAG
jgi:lipoyl-dependent peroxiredoxin